MQEQETGDIMIIGLGIDIVDSDRILSWKGNPGLISRFFADDEIIEAKKRGKGYLFSLAARFAAKEAFGKALGTGLKGIKLRDIKVLNDASGKPVMKIEKTALKAYEKCGAGKIHLSLTHEKSNAVAVVIIEE